METLTNNLQQSGNTGQDKTIAEFLSFLLYDRKFDVGRLEQIKSELKTFNEFFRERVWSRKEFLSFVYHLTEERKLSKGSVNNFIALGKNYDRFLGTNELHDFRYFKQAKKIIPTLSPEEIKKLAMVNVKYLRRRKYLNQLYKNLILFLATTGCRIEEALNLKKNDLMESAVIFRNTKTDHERLVPVDRRLLYQLFTLSPGDLVFTSYRNEKLCAPGVNQELKRRAKLIGTETRVSCHVFRHSFITHMLDIGASIHDIADIVGHQDLQTTREYNQQSVGHLREVIYLHPLLRAKQELSIVSKRVKELISKIVDINKFQLTINEDQESISIKIESAKQIIKH